jgi:single-strand DNA-binding protein
VPDGHSGTGATLRTVLGQRGIDMSDNITIVGVVGTDPERKNPKGLPITTFRVATRERRFDRATGAWADGETNWYTVSAYRRLAEHVFDSVHKRDRVILTGRLRVRNWETGESRGTAVDIDLDAIGHDLLWGTSVFTRDEREAGSNSAPPASSDDGWTAQPAAEATWGSPGVESAASEADHGRGSGDGDHAGGDDVAGTPSPRPLALAGVETPF